MAIPRHKKAVSLTLDRETVNKLDALRKSFPNMSRSVFVGSLIDLVDMGSCKDVIKEIIKKHK